MVEPAGAAGAAEGTAAGTAEVVVGLAVLLARVWRGGLVVGVVAAVVGVVSAVTGGVVGAVVFDGSEEDGEVGRRVGSQGFDLGLLEAARRDGRAELPPDACEAGSG